MPRQKPMRKKLKDYRGICCSSFYPSLPEQGKFLVARTGGHEGGDAVGGSPHEFIRFHLAKAATVETAVAGEGVGGDGVQFMPNLG